MGGIHLRRCTLLVVLVVSAMTCPLWAEQQETHHSSREREKGLTGINWSAVARAGVPEENGLPTPTQAVPNAVTPNSLSVYMSGNTSYQVLAGQARLMADNVSNDSYSTTTGTLRLSLWLSSAAFPASGYRTAVYTLGQLSPRYYFYAIDSGWVTFSTPPAGCYHVAMLLEEYDGTQYVYDDYVSYSNLLSINNGCQGPSINTFVASPSSITAGSSTLLSWSTANASSASIDHGIGGVGVNSAVTVAPSSTTTYTLTANGNSQQVTRSVTVIVAPVVSNPSVSISGSPTSGSAPFSSNFNASASGGSPPYSYHWSTGESGSSISHTWSSAGTYTQSCTVTDSAGKTATSNSMTIVASPSGGCADPKVVCLSNNRFSVRVTWKTSSDSGTGTPIKFTPDSGLFWFFGSDNIEVLLKVLNACSYNNRYWIFAAATTDVEYTITVTDTLTGRVKTYFHAGGSPAPAITDTDAIPCS
jgi:hypothetical protein